MTFYQELKEFFKTNDPQRLYMANTIARKFRLGTEQKVVLNRLKVIYDNGGPANIVLGNPYDNAAETAAITEESVDSVMEESASGQANVEVEIEIEGAAPEVEIEIEGAAPEVEIDTPDDEENKEA